MRKFWKRLRLAVLICLLLVVLAAISGLAYLKWRNRLPDDVTEALAAPEAATHYSLDPADHYRRPVEGEVRFHRFKILGHTELDSQQTAAACREFESAVSRWYGVEAFCFDARHGLRVISRNHTYDFLLCYECLQLEVYRDDMRVASLGAAGSPKVLNGILTVANVPLAKEP